MHRNTDHLDIVLNMLNLHIIPRMPVLPNEILVSICETCKGYGMPSRGSLYMRRSYLCLPYCYLRTTRWFPLGQLPIGTYQLFISRIMHTVCGLLWFCCGHTIANFTNFLHGLLYWLWNIFPLTVKQHARISKLMTRTHKDLMIKPQESKT